MCVCVCAAGGVSYGSHSLYCDSHYTRNCSGFVAVLPLFAVLPLPLYFDSHHTQNFRHCVHPSTPETALLSCSETQHVTYEYEANTLHTLHEPGSHLLQGFAVIMGPQIFPFIVAVRHGVERLFLGVIFWTIFVYRSARTHTHAHKLGSSCFVSLSLSHTHACARALLHARKVSRERKTDHTRTKTRTHASTDF